MPGSGLVPGTEQGTPPGYSNHSAAPTQAAQGFPLRDNSFFGERPERNSVSGQPEARGVREPGFPWQSFLLSQGQVTESPERRPRGFFLFC